MNHERFPADDPREWISRARSNLIQASTRVQGVYLEDLCFQAQQAAEKALKGALLFQNKPFPHTHDIAHLISLLDTTNAPLPPMLDDAAILTQYAVATRYPGVVEPVDNDEYEEALELASAIVSWAEQLVLNRNES